MTTPPPSAPAIRLPKATRVFGTYFLLLALLLLFPAGVFVSCSEKKEDTPAGQNGPDAAEDAAAVPEEKKFDFVLDRTEELIESGLFDSVNHLDFFRWKLVRDYVPATREERFRDLFSRMVRRGMKLELNVSGIRKDFQSFLPCFEVWKWSLDYPLERYYGSDAHDPSQLGCETERAAEWLAMTAAK